MSKQPNLDDINVPAELEERLDQLPEAQKEPARQSLRFGVFLLTTGLVVAVNVAGQTAPIFSQIPVEALQTLTWEIVALGLGFIGARTYRNSK